MIGEMLARAARNAFRRMTLHRLAPDCPTMSDGQLSLRDIAILTRKLSDSNLPESVGKAGAEQS